MKRSTFEQYVTEYCEDLAVKENAYQYKRCRHACVLTYNDVIISSGVNSKLFCCDYESDETSQQDYS